MTISPPYLKKGDTVLLIATARARNQEQVQPAIDILISWGFRVEIGKHLYRAHHQFAGTDDERAHDLQWAVDHPTAKAVFLSGGGYGALRIIDGVDFGSLKSYPKWFVGYSDTTVIHARILKTGFACIHGTMAFQFTKNGEATESIRALLTGERPSYDIPTHTLNRLGRCNGELVGGNLSLLYALSGSRDDIDTNDKILFIEDLDEQLYHIDRMMLQLKRSGKLARLKGLIVGGMSEMRDNAVPYGQTAEEIISDAVKQYSYPVCYNFPSGHIERNLAICLGQNIKLQVSEMGVIFEHT